MKVIIDTNLWISSLIGKGLRLFDQVFKQSNVTVYVCDELIEEFLDVARRPKIGRYIATIDVALALHLMETTCVYFKVNGVTASPVRDPGDLYLLSLADAVDADYLVTGDKDLLVLGHHHRTLVITYTQLLSLLKLG